MKKLFIYLIAVILTLLLIIVISISLTNSSQQIDRNMLRVVLIDLFNNNLSNAKYYGVKYFYVSINGQDIDNNLIAMFNSPIRTIKIRPSSGSYIIDTKNIDMNTLFSPEYSILVRDNKTNERGILFTLNTNQDKTNSYTVKVFTYAGGLFSSEIIYTLEKKYNIWTIVNTNILWIS